MNAPGFGAPAAQKGVQASENNTPTAPRQVESLPTLADARGRP
jgi:hypothetical protein